MGSARHAGEKRTYLLDLVSIEIGYHSEYYPWQRAAEIHGLVHGEGHDAGGENVVLHIRIPGHPQALKVVELHIVFGDLLEAAPVCRGRRGKRVVDGGVPAAEVSGEDAR